LVSPSGLKTIFQFMAMAGSALALISVVGIFFTSRVVDAGKDAEIQRLKPRSLTDDQKNRLRTIVASKKARIGISSKLLDGESADFADQISAVFREAGWEIVPPNRTSMLDLPGFVTLLVTDPALASLSDFIAASLKTVGISCQRQDIAAGKIGEPIQPNAIYVVVGRKL
jgi:hypothetical protein